MFVVQRGRGTPGVLVLEGRVSAALPPGSVQFGLVVVPNYRCGTPDAAGYDPEKAQAVGYSRVGLVASTSTNWRLEIPGARLAATGALLDVWITLRNGGAVRFEGVLGDAGDTVGFPDIILPAKGEVGVYRNGAPVVRPAAQGCVPATPNAVMVALLDEPRYAFQPKTITFEVGKTYNVTIEAGREYHTFTSRELGIDREVSPGVDQTFTFTPVKAGAFRLICVPHEVLGMAGTIVVR